MNWFKVLIIMKLLRCATPRRRCSFFLNKKKYDIVTYIDPDVLFFSELSELSDKTKSIYLTPHILTSTIPYCGDASENELLKYGIYNCGFIAIRNTEVGKCFLQWWMEKLTNQCYSDAEYGLYTDQKWVDFVPSLFPLSDIMIIRNMGYNVAPWNYFEREVKFENNDFLIIDRTGASSNIDKLCFVHYSGYNYAKLTDDVVEHNYRKLRDYQDVQVLLHLYGNELKQANVKEYFELKYSFSTFSNDKLVMGFHRRLYRVLLERHKCIKKPFDSNGEFYRLLKANHLISNSKPDIKKKNVKNFEKKYLLLCKFYDVIFKILKVDKYVQALKAFQFYSRFEQQEFLLR